MPEHALWQGNGILSKCLACRTRRHPPGTKTAFCLLLAARVVGALVNTIHDCDEVYNYWEPLHFLLYGSGMQTWEYR